MIADPIVLVDRDGVIRFWSEGAEKMFGYSVAQAVGRNLDLIVPSEHQEAHWKGFMRAMERHTAAVEGRAVPFPARHADGEIRVRVGSPALVRRPHGEVVGAMVVFELGPPTE